ncbi:MAG: Peptide methionine sulfoxide reductase, partial [Parcubacteria group bacterium GW2011_GWA2_51_10]
MDRSFSISRQAALIFSGIVVLVVGVGIFLNSFWGRPNTVYVEAQAALASSTKSSVLAGGCFWCVEADFEKLPGVVDVISGYAGGKTENPTSPVRRTVFLFFRTNSDNVFIKASRI